MSEEDQNQMCSNSSGGGGGGGDGGGCIIPLSLSSKKLKLKKVPQRGLGVAQLEKIRMEEQQKNDNNNNNISTSSTILSTKSSSQHTNDQKPSKTCVPYSPPSPPPMPIMNLSPQNPTFRACDSLLNTENFYFGSNPINGDGLQVGWPSNPVHGNFSFPNLFHPTPHKFSLDQTEVENSIYRPGLSSGYEACNIPPLPDLVPRSSSTQIQLPPPNSLVNVSSMNTLSSSSSFLNFSMEPPSNQRFYCNYSPFLWPDDEKTMVGMKRSSPVPLDDPPIPIFNSKIAPMASTHPLIRSDEPIAHRNGKTAYNFLDCELPTFSNMPSCLTTNTMPELAKSRKISRTENGNSHAQELLSWAPSTISSSFPNPQFNSLPYQVSIEDTLVDSRQSGSSQKSNMFSSFPPAKQQRTTSTPTPTPTPPPRPPPAAHNRCDSEVGENIDLNLRL